MPIIKNCESKIKSFIFLLFTFSFLLFTLSSIALASIEIDPMRLELEAVSDKTITGYITIKNHGDEDIDLSFSAGEYRYIIPGNAPSCKAWISLNPDKIKVEKEKQQEIQYSIKIPAYSKGEYVASVLIDKEQQPEPINLKEKGQVRVKITPRINMPVYVTIKNSLVRSCSITELATLQSEDKKSVDFSVSVKNTGTTHIRPAIILAILDENKAVVKKIPVGKALPIFAGFAEKFSAKWNAPEKNKYTVVATVDMGNGDFIQNSSEFEVK